MCKKCDHTSVGILVWKSSKMLLVNRKKYPFGFAPPAGHVDAWGSYEQAAVAELYEETGLKADTLSLLIEGKKDNPCPRQDGDWHYWRIYKATASGPLHFSSDETAGGNWFARHEIFALASAKNSLRNPSMDLEEVWCQWFRDLRLIENFEQLMNK